MKLTLPRPSPAYDAQDQANTRRTIGQAFERTIGRPWQPHEAIDLGGDELFPGLTGSGREMAASLAELMRRGVGVINPSLPPYNCKGDARESRNGGG